MGQGQMKKKVEQQVYGVGEDQGEVAKKGAGSRGGKSKRFSKRSIG